MIGDAGAGDAGASDAGAGDPAFLCWVAGPVAAAMASRNAGKSSRKPRRNKGEGEGKGKDESVDASGREQSSPADGRQIHMSASFSRYGVYARGSRHVAAYMARTPAKACGRKPLK
jgi:hypothetical protein